MTENVRGLVISPKEIEQDTGWKSTRILPSHAPMYIKTKPARPRWEWRSLHVSDSNAQRHVCLFQVSPDFGKWNAWLITEYSDGNWSVVVRLEDQPGKKGLHAHTNCAGELKFGPDSISLPERRPPHGEHHRRQGAWTRHSFFVAATDIFRIECPENPQSEMPL